MGREVQRNREEWVKLTVRLDGIGGCHECHAGPVDVYRERGAPERYCAGCLLKRRVSAPTRLKEEAASP